MGVLMILLVTDELGDELGFEGCQDDASVGNGGAYPNPFNQSISFNVIIPTASLMDVYVINDECHRVKTIINSEMFAGVHNITWDGKNDSNESIDNGYYRIIISDYIDEFPINIRKQ